MYIKALPTFTTSLNITHVLYVILLFEGNWNKVVKVNVLYMHTQLSTLPASLYLSH